MKAKTKTLLEEAIKSWNSEIKDLKKAMEWIHDGETKYGSAIKHKKELIEDAKILLKEIS